jgi:drug/metabolite transporter (DMT)-like permease
MIGIGFALFAALSWGAGDFCGGLASRKMNHFQVVILTALSSLLLLILFSIIWAENLPSKRDTIIALLAGISGALGLAALYKGLTLGNSALVAPTAGVIGAIIPTLVGLIIEGLPSMITLMGFVLSIMGIWLVSHYKEKGENNAKAGLRLAVLAGFGFGGFLSLIAQIEGEQVFIPLIFSKMASLILALFLIRIRQLPFPNPTRSPVAILTGFLDTGGNILYMFATNLIRLDIAAVLSSLYPAATVVLSSLLLKEEISIRQWIGAFTCVAATMLITSG